MKFFLGEGVEIDLSDEMSKNIILINDPDFIHKTFTYKNLTYSLEPIEFKIDDVYFLFNEIYQKNKDKKIFIHHFEPLANGFFAMYFAVEV